MEIEELKLKCVNCNKEVIVKVEDIEVLCVDCPKKMLDEITKLKDNIYTAIVNKTLRKKEPVGISTIEDIKKYKISLSRNEQNKKSLIATYIIPDNLDFDFHPDDPFQEIVFIPRFIPESEIISGIIEIELEKEGEKPTPLYREKAEKSVNGFRGRWEEKNIGNPGDKINFYFEADKVINAEKSVLYFNVCGLK